MRLSPYQIQSQFGSYAQRPVQQYAGHEHWPHIWRQHEPLQLGANCACSTVISTTILARRSYYCPICRIHRCDTRFTEPIVFDRKTGARIAPRYNHHVDDNMYGDNSKLMPHAAAASIISLYKIVGSQDGQIPDPISRGKFGSVHSHI